MTVSSSATGISFTPGSAPGSALSASSIAFTTNAGIIGTTTNDNAAAGSVGEIIESEVLAGAAVSQTNGVNMNVTSINLTAGDWDVWGIVQELPAGSTVSTAIFCSINNVSSTQATAPNKGAYSQNIGSWTGASIPTSNIGMRRYSLAVTTTVYLVAQNNFTVSTSAAYGYIGARRVR